MKANQAAYPIATQCRVLGVSPSGYYAWRARPPSARACSDAALKERIGTIHADSQGTYGVPRIYEELKASGESVGRKRIARLMGELGIEGVTRRQRRHTTVRDDDARPAPDLVDREFAADAPNRLWVADITYCPTWAGFVYLAVVLDVFSRRVVGWAMANHLRTELVLEALNMALGQRRPENVIHHSDQGSQYTSIAFAKRCERAGVRPSMGSVGDCYDNALAESFFATLECELIDRSTWRTHGEARQALFEYIEGWYNPRRRHSSIDYLSPMQYERRYVMHATSRSDDVELATVEHASRSPDQPTSTGLTPPLSMGDGQCVRQTRADAWLRATCALKTTFSALTALKQF